MALEEDLVWYLAWRSNDYGTPVTKTRLVKYLYLVDLVLTRDAITRRYGIDGVAGYIRASGGQVSAQIRRALRADAVLQPRDLAYAIHHFGDDLDVSNLLAGASA